MHNIHFFDLSRQYSAIKDELLSAVRQVFERSAFSGGEFVEKFEGEFSQYCQVKHTVGVNNGTNALHLALLAAGVTKGDEVILPANTFIATAWAVSYVGAVPVFVDCREDDWQISPEQVQKKITPRTKAIIGVHLFGMPCDLDALQQIAKEHQLLLIEDASQAHGALYQDKPVGGFGRLACFSFYPGKNLGTSGEGGCVCTADDDLAQRMRGLRNHGSTTRYYHDEIGFNMRMGGLEAATLSVKLKYLDRWNRRRQLLAQRYREGITSPKIKLQATPQDRQSVSHLFVVTTEKRDQLIAHLNAHHIFPGIHYPVPCHLQKAYAALGYKRGDCPQVEYLSDHCLSLPLFPELTDDEQDQVIGVINKY